MTLAISPNFSHQPAAESTTKPSPITTLVASDADQSAISWRDFNKVSDQVLVESNAEVINNNPLAALAIVTGRGLKMSKDLIAHLGSYGKKLVAWIANNGQQVYYRPVDKPATEWLNDLTVTDADAEWSSHIQDKTGWQAERVCDVILNALSRNGFEPAESVAHYEKYSESSDLFVKHHAQDNKRVVVEIMPDETAFVIRPQYYGDTMAMAHAFKDGVKLSGDITQTLRAEGMAYDMIVKDHPNVFMHYMYMPEGIQKDSALAWLLAKDDRLKQVSRVIPVGDSDNDETMLLKESYFLDQHGDDRVIPSYPILSGILPRLFQRLLAVNPRAIETRQQGDLAEALETQMNAH